ncbi:hypothetical protein Y032_0270g855 [Ancylostoma ceylanicum]|uniref:G-patch domain-containing protein n=3 Tax=Ancylostoma ceylanicum TaxID=53326 RepID=A0A016S8K2_9BILA|nr:hypothetical protein Y032_0270g855 [Ancylostoma ceylanicum]
MRLMQKMGWRPGEGLGPDGMGNVEPLVLDVKNDRRGLVAQDDLGGKGGSVPKGGADLIGSFNVLTTLLSRPDKWM